MPTPNQNLDSKTNAAGFEPIRFSPPANPFPANNDFKEYTARLDRSMLEISTALNLLVRWLQPVNFSVVASGTLAASGTSQVVLRQNPDRRFAAIINSEAATDVYLSLTAVAISGAGITLKPGGVFSFGTNTDMKYTGEVSAITAGAGAVLTFIEA